MLHEENGAAISSTIFRKDFRQHHQWINLEVSRGFPRELRGGFSNF